MRQKTLAGQGSDEEEMSPSLTPSGSRRGSRRPSDDGRGSRTPRRGSIFDILMPKKEDPDEVKKDVTVDDIRNWVVKNPTVIFTMEYINCGYILDKILVACT